MARIRTIKPEFCVSEQLAECSPNARLVFVLMWMFCDDQGIHPAKPKTLKAEIFPMDDISADRVAELVGELVLAGLLVEYSVESETYWKVTGWERHQKIDKPSSKYPRPLSEHSPNPPRTLAEPSPPESKGVEGSRREGDSTNRRRTPSRKTPMPPGFGISDRVREWAARKGYGRLDEHLEAFRCKAVAKGYSYADWDEALMGAIRDNWAGLKAPMQDADKFRGVL